ncbi:hypothetical protein GCM10012279_55410 [Micromonospora yangpuensis]|nr:hypothetical protein GCM10012279_55410 [Micromonospora yangpuensis]
MPALFCPCLWLGLPFLPGDSIVRNVIKVLWSAPGGVAVRLGCDAPRSGTASIPGTARLVRYVRGSFRLRLAFGLLVGQLGVAGVRAGPKAVARARGPAAAGPLLIL